MTFDASFFLDALWAAILHAPQTIGLVFFSFIIGVAGGLPLAIVQVFHVPWFAFAARAYVILARSVPLVLVLLILYLAASRGWARWGGGAAAFGGDSPPGGVMVAVATLSFWAAGAIAEAFRAALQAVPRGQFEAACSVGLGRRQALTRILLPQAVPAALPVLCNALISLVKGSSVVFLISVVDLLNGALIKATANYRYLEAYAAAAVVYWAINATVGRVGRWLENRHAGQERGRRA